MSNTPGFTISIPSWQIPAYLDALQIGSVTAMMCSEKERKSFFNEQIKQLELLVPKPYKFLKEINCDKMFETVCAKVVEIYALNPDSVNYNFVYSTEKSGKEWYSSSDKFLEVKIVYTVNSVEHDFTLKKRFYTAYKSWDEERAFPDQISKFFLEFEEYLKSL